MHISSNQFLFSIYDKWRGNVSSLSFDDVRITAKDQSVSLADIRSAPEIQESWLGNELSLNIASLPMPLRVRGANKVNLARDAAQIEKAWRDFNVQQLEAHADDIKSLLSALADLKSPTRYPSACYVQPLLRKAEMLEKEILSKLNVAAIGQDRIETISEIRSFFATPAKVRNTAISKFETAQLALWGDFFDTFEQNPLTPEQRLSIVADEDATLVLAGAGSGKTSVITAKAGYLLKSGIRKPEEVLLLAFARDAAAEMSDRIQERCGEPVEARTFHALAYDIIGLVEGGKPALAAHATDDKAFLVLIRDILIHIAKTVPEASKAIIDWFKSARLEEKSEWDFKQKHDFYTYLEKEDLRTLQGEKVKSFEELMIANWLYENGVEYEYEPDYEFATSDPTKKNYCPDFRLTESGVYLEHFGVRKQRGRDGNMTLVTAPWVDQDEYLEGMAWKRQVHEDNDTVLLETFSYDRVENRLLEVLAQKIEPYEELKPRAREDLFDRVVEMNQIDSFVQLLANFLRNFKSGGYRLADCNVKAKKAKLGKRASAFLAVFAPVFQAYEDSLDTRIDFEDMVLRAAKYVETGRFKSPYKHVLVDEFQDISRSRARLVKALLSQHHDARLFAVGDDWQSIYRFAGSDIHLMRNFGQEFGGEFNGANDVHRTVDLGRTFRSVDKIAFAARHFVLQNPTQLAKTVIPAGISDGPAISIVSTFKHDEDVKLKAVLNDLNVKAKNANKRSSVLLLGRYRHSAPEGMRRLSSSYPDLDINFKTIHASKGLEADHVVLLQVFSGRIGFPSEIVDDPLLTMVSPEAEPFEHAEERRVMYVAMTRARKSLTIMGTSARQSSFVKELIDDDAYELTSEVGGDAEVHTCGECQGSIFSVPKKKGGAFFRCEHTELCGNTLPACAVCDTGLPARKSDKGDATCSCGEIYRPCPSCSDGWLVERRGRYGKFMSCVKFPRCNGKAKV
ncbi:UvrD-helicase domain-containing protein [Pacificibacter marinus]|uniref:UvrD-helicase domain-containing protein n=1 Tax=Pacificibacter marinus TaxID=658057 RepID=UPI001C06668F|nr:UvrD-helicase domain-containing protein [Pacificibacter marinus]MBU2868949.1 UvrD-helicase domain-containing protein [Pacificibacter marinus]